MTHPIERVATEFSRVDAFTSFLDSLSRPSPAVQWLEQAAAQLRQARDPDGAKRANRVKIKMRLIARDGADCWYCGKALGEDVTLEHLTPLALQGSWADDNLALAHTRCNKAAGHLTRSEKQGLREEMRAEVIRMAQQIREQEASNG